MLDPLELRRRLIWKMRDLEDRGQGMTQKELATKAGQSKMTIQNLRRAVCKQYHADTLVAVAEALGEAPDFFFRPDWPGARAEESVEHRIFRAVRTNENCDTFTIVCTHTDGAMEVIAWVRGEMVYRGPERRVIRKPRHRDDDRREP